MVAEKAVDLRTDQKSFSAISTAAIRTIQPIIVQRKREHSNRWKKRKKQNWSATLRGQDLRRCHSRQHPHYTIQPFNPRPPSPTTHTQTIGPLSHQLTPNHSPYLHLRANSRLRKSTTARPTPKARASRLPNSPNSCTAILRHDHANIRWFHPRIPK